MWKVIVLCLLLSVAFYGLQTKAQNTDPNLQKMTNQFVNALSSALGVNPMNFQLRLGTQFPVNDDLWFAYLNQLPPAATLANQISTSTSGTLSASFGLLIGCLKISTPDLQTTLGNDYASFLKCWNALTDPFNLTQCLTCRKAAPNHVGAATTYCDSLVNNPLQNVNEAYNDPSNWQEGKVQGTPMYATNQDIAFSQATSIANPSASFSFSSDSADGSTTNQYGQGTAQGAYDFFSATASAQSSSVTLKLASQEVTVSLQIDHWAKIDATPKGWYSGSVVTYAYNNQDNFAVWQSTGNCNTTVYFGPNGLLKGQIGEVIVTNSMSLTITTEATFSSSEQTYMTAAASGGFWPFFSASASGESSSSVSFDSSGHATFTWTSPAGSPQIIGVNVINPAKTSSNLHKLRAALGTNLQDTTRALEQVKRALGPVLGYSFSSPSCSSLHCIPVLFDCYMGGSNNVLIGEYYGSFCSQQSLCDCTACLPPAHQYRVKHSVLNCPLLPPISAEDCANYLSSASAVEHPFHETCQQVLQHHGGIEHHHGHASAYSTV